MLSEVRWRPLADEQYRAICANYPPARGTIDGLLRTIGYAGATRPFLPNSGGLRNVETPGAGHGVPKLILVYSQDADGVFWVEEVRVR